MRSLYLVMLLSILPGCASQSLPQYDCASLPAGVLETEITNDTPVTSDRRTNLISEVERQLNREHLNIVEQAAAYYCFAEQQYVTGHTTVAMKLYERSIELYPEHPLPYFSLATIYEKNGDYQKALENIDACLDIDETLPLANLVKARIELAMGNHDRALEALSYERRNSAESGDYLSLEELHGDILSSVQRHDEAIVAYRRALDIANKHSLWRVGDAPQLFPKQLMLYKKLINSYCSAGMVDEAMSTYADALERNIQAETISASCIQ